MARTPAPSSFFPPARFAVEEQLSARVFVASDRLTGQQVAFRWAASGAEEDTAALRDEFLLLSRFTQANLPRPVDFGVGSPGPAWLAMEFAPGERVRGPLELADLRALVHGLGTALAAVHAAGVLHRDLKPSNVRFEASTGRVTLLGLGCATPAGAPFDVAGSLCTVAPEVASGAAAGVASDLYSLGAVLYEAATGTSPFSGTEQEVLKAQAAGRFEPANRLRPDLPVDIARVLGALLDPSPERRPASVVEATGRLLLALAPASEAAAVSSESRSDELDARAAAGHALGWATFVGGNVPGALAAWQDVLAIRRGPGGSPALAGCTLSKMALALCASGEYAEALATAEQALALAEARADQRLEAEACWALGRTYAALGASPDSLTWQLRSLDVASAVGDRLGRSRALSELGVLLVRQGALVQGAQRLAEGAQEAQGCDQPGQAALCRARLGRVQVMQGRLGEGIRAVEQALREAVAGGDELVRIEAQRTLGIVCCELGDFERGMPLLENALRDCRQAGLFQDLPATHEALARAHLRRALRLRTATGAVLDRAEIERARLHVELGSDVSASSDRMADRASLRCLSAVVRLVGGDPARACAEAAEAERIAGETGDALVAARARLVRAEALLAGREFGDALTLAKSASAVFAETGVHEDAWRAHALLARLHATWGVADRAEVEASAARRLLRQAEESLGDPALARVFVSDVERRAAIDEAAGTAGERARRLVPRALSTERFEGHVDTEDLVDAVLEARRNGDALRAELDAARADLHALASPLPPRE